MKKEYRVKKSEDFNQIIKLKQSLVNDAFVIYYRKNDTHLHVGISASKKLGNAVVRNKIKRQIRMMAQELFDKDDCMDIIIIVRAAYLRHTFLENKGRLKSLFIKSKKRMG